MKPSDLKEAIAKALFVEDAGIYEIPAWLLSKEHENALVFVKNIECLFIRFEHATPDKVGKLSKKYEDDEKCYVKAMNETRGSVPFELSVIHKETDSGCIVDATVKPILYQKVAQFGENPPEVEIQDSHMRSEEFIRRIFEGGLSGTDISKERSMIPRAAELLINDSRIRQIYDKLNWMLGEAKREVLIMGWIGTILLHTFRELKKRQIPISIITGNIKGIRQDSMQKEKEKAMAELPSILGDSFISFKLDLHGRMVIVDDMALIGSMDMDSSLTGARTELAVYTEDPTIVTRLREYFKSVFTPMKKTIKQEKQETH